MKRSAIIQILTLLIVCSTSAASMELNQVKFVESDGSRLIATSNYNYAISSPKLQAKNWRTVSVNGDNVLVITLTGERTQFGRASMAPADLSLIESLRDEIAASSNGYTHISTASSGSGGSGMMMSSQQGISSSSSSSFSSSSNAAGGGIRNGEMSYNVRDSNNYSIARSDLPFNWSRIFINDDLATLVCKNGDVQMMPIGSLEPNQAEEINRLKVEMADMQRSQAQQFSSTMHNSMDMVSNVFNNIMGRFPRPPDYGSAVGSAFGNNFPFGPNNSPFSSASGWPFGDGGAGAMAFASRR